MIQTINFNQFYDAFYNSSYKDNFSYDGLRALYDYLISYEEDTGTELEFDMVALCCDYTEYDDLFEVIEAYSLQLDLSDLDLNDLEPEDLENIKNQLEDLTTIIEVENDKIIIQNF
jgi:hypothetical protein